MEKSESWENLFKFLVDEVGVTAIEYAFIAGLIALVIVMAVTSIGVKLQQPFNSIASILR